MKIEKNERWQVAWKALGLSLIPALMMSSGMFAISASAEDVVEEVVVTGSRGKPRTVEDTPFAVDVFSQSEIEEALATLVINGVASPTTFHLSHPGKSSLHQQLQKHPNDR